MTGMRVALPAALAAILAAGAPRASDPAGNAWPGFAVGKEVARAAEPARIVHAGDGSGRLFVAERGGRIVVFGGEASSQAVFLDLSERVAARDGGLRDVAFPYDFVDKRRFYVSYVGRRRELVVARFALEPGGASADAGGEQVLLRVWLPGAERPGGGIAFGADGKLYLGVGEGVAARESAGQAQSLASLLGKILRIDVESATTPYGVPPDNPWSKAAGARPEIWATGLGNPTRLSFDPKTGELYVADAAGDRREEIDVQPGTSGGGENYGWNLMEGTACRSAKPCGDSGLTMPAAVLDRSKGCELSPGVVARGWPDAATDGIYFFAEGCSRRLRGLRRSHDGGWESRAVLRAKFPISAVGVGEDGRLFVADARTGAIHEVSPGPPARGE